MALSLKAPGRRVGSPAQSWSILRAASVLVVTVLLGSLVAPSANAAVGTQSPDRVPRIADCPAATATVSTAKQLVTALAMAKPGNVIKLAPGRYVGEFKASASGTASAPIWLCGPRTAILTTGSYSSGHALYLNAVSDVVIAGFTIDTAFKGLTVVKGTRVAVSDLSITNIGYEAVHLRGQTVDSAVSYNLISRTGLVVDKYGEGIYIGTSNANWCQLNQCNPDRTDRIIVRGNIISDTGAQPIEVKEGTSNGYIENNIVTGTTRMETYSKALILVKGNGYVVVGNKVTAPPLYGLQTITSDGGWGRSNTFAANSVIGVPDQAIWIHRAGADPLGNVVSCSNTTDGTKLTNVTCAR